MVAASATTARADLLVLSSSGSSSHIKRFNAATGVLLDTFGHETEAYYSMTLTPREEVLVTSNTLGYYDLYRFDRTGGFRGSGGTGWMAGFEGATRGPDGRLYAIVHQEASGRSSIARIDTGPPVVFVGHGVGGMTDPAWMVFGPDEDLYVSDRAAGILRFNGTTGAALGVMVPLGHGGLPDVARMLFGPDGRLYVASARANAVLRFDGATGALVDTFVAPGSGGLSNPQGLAFDPDGHLCVTSRNTHQVLRYNGRTGDFLGVAAAVETPAGDPGTRLGDIVFVARARAGE